MKHRLLLVLSVAATSFVACKDATGKALVCYQNPLTPFHCKLVKVTCKDTHRCYRRTGTVQRFSLTSRGCAPSRECRKLFKSTFMGHPTSLKTDCCNRPLCNGSIVPTGTLVPVSAALFRWLMRL